MKFATPSFAPASLTASLTAALTAALMLTLNGCTTTSPDVVNRNEAQRLSTVIDAVVLSTRPVVVDGSQSGLGAATGGAIGGIAGSSIGGSRDSLVIGVIGALVGGVIGNATERNATREEAQEILVQLRNGDRRSVVQARAAETFAPGDPVILVTTGGRVRVTRAPTVAPNFAPNVAPATTMPALRAPTGG